VHPSVEAVPEGGGTVLSSGRALPMRLEVTA
jgi:hypothetical protein